MGNIQVMWLQTSINLAKNIKRRLGWLQTIQHPATWAKTKLVAWCKPDKKTASMELLNRWTLWESRWNLHRVAIQQPGLHCLAARHTSLRTLGIKQNACKKLMPVGIRYHQNAPKKTNQQPLVHTGSNWQRNCIFVDMCVWEELGKCLSLIFTTSDWLLDVNHQASDTIVVQQLG